MSGDNKKQEWNPEAKALVDAHKMQPHPEGGYFVETYRSDVKVKTAYGERCAGTAIYFLIMPGNVSHLHILTMDEVWHFYKGGPMVVVELDASTSEQYRCTVLGPDASKGHKV